MVTPTIPQETYSKLPEYASILVTGYNNVFVPSGSTDKPWKPLMAGDACGLADLVGEKETEVVMVFGRATFINVDQTTHPSVHLPPAGVSVVIGFASQIKKDGTLPTTVVRFADLLAYVPLQKKNCQG